MDTLNWILIYIYSIAHILGKFFLNVLDLIIDFSRYPVKLIDPIGFLIILTIFFIIAVLARKVAKWILIISWIFILFKLIMTIYER